MSIYHDLLANKIKLLELQNEMMRILSTSKGFDVFYASAVFQFETKIEAFDYCNQFYKGMFGDFRYSNYQEFIKRNSSASCSEPSSVEIMEREYLLAWFKGKGFNTWTSFKALVTHYYPLTVESFLYEFWQNKPVDAETQKNVGYVKQIIGE